MVDLGWFRFIGKSRKGVLQNAFLIVRLGHIIILHRSASRVEVRVLVTESAQPGRSVKQKPTALLTVHQSLERILHFGGQFTLEIFIRRNR
jgi:hypothetical protein